MSLWASNVLMDLRKEVTEYKAGMVDEASLERWTSVGSVKQKLGQVGTEGAVTVSCRCMHCEKWPKDDFIRYLLRKSTKNGTEATSITELFMVKVVTAKWAPAWFTMQYGGAMETCLVLQAA